MLDLSLFDHLEDWCTLGDYHAQATWDESPTPDVRYNVRVDWRFRGKLVGYGDFVIEPIPNVTDERYRIYWFGLQFADDAQQQGIYSNLVDKFTIGMPKYNVHQVIATPTSKEAERRLSARGFAWDGTDFVLAF
jgi:hypothetical protein